MQRMAIARRQSMIPLTTHAYISYTRFAAARLWSQARLEEKEEIECGERNGKGKIQGWDRGSGTDPGAQVPEDMLVKHEGLGRA